MNTIRKLLRRIKHFLSTYYTYASIALALFILVLGYFLFIQERFTRIQDIGTTSLQQKEDELSLKQSNLARLKRAQEEFKSFDVKELEQLKGVLPRSSDIPALFVQMKKLAEELQLELLGIDVTEKGAVAPGAEAQASSSVRQVAITISIQGIESYEQLKQFFDRIENNMRILDISAVGYQPGTDSYTVNLTTYYLQEV